MKYTRNPEWSLVYSKKGFQLKRNGSDVDGSPRVKRIDNQAALCWELIGNGLDLKQMVTPMCIAFQQDPNTILDEMKKITQELKQLGIILQSKDDFDDIPTDSCMTREHNQLFKNLKGGYSRLKRDELRSAAYHYFKQGKSPWETAKELQIVYQTVFRWFGHFKTEGEFKETTRGPKHLLSASQQNRLARLLHDNPSPRTLGLDATRWTGASMQECIKKYFKIKICRLTGLRYLEKLKGNDCSEGRN